MIRYLAATLDGMVEPTGAVFEGKFMLPWAFSEEGATEKYMPQLQHNMWITNAKTAVLSRDVQAALADAVSRMAAQKAGPIAVARPDPTAAERRVRAVVELVVEAAMVRAVGTAAVAVGAAMVAEPPRQGLRALPVHRDNEAV